MRRKVTAILLVAGFLAGILLTAIPVGVEVRDGLPYLIIGNRVSAQAVNYTCDGINDDETFQDAIDALDDGGGMLYVLAGVYQFADGQTVSRAIDNVSIVGLGGATRFEGDGATAIFTAGGDNWLFANVRVDAGGIDMLSTADWCWLNVWNGTELYGLLTDAGVPGGMESHGNEYHVVALATEGNLTAVNATLADAVGDIAAMNVTLNDAVADIADLVADLTALNNTVNGLSGDIAALQASLSALNVTVQNHIGNSTGVHGVSGTVLGTEDVDDSPANGATTDPISSNWAYDHGDATKLIAIIYIIDGGGSAITTGVKGFLEIPFACNITGWTLTSDQSGNVTIDVWKDTYTYFPPNVADTIAGSEKPSLAAAQKNQDLNLTTWTTAVSAGDHLGFNVDSVATVTRLTLTIRAERF